METKRKPLQGIINIMRFNWHLYLLAACLFIITILIIVNTDFAYKSYVSVAVMLSFAPFLLSIIISYYIYDYSNVYTLPWTNNIEAATILNIHAGFDETSTILSSKHKTSHIISVDFYDPEKHTEVSIKRARKIYPPSAGNIIVSSSSLPFQEKSFDYVHIAFAAHEIRDEAERITFFQEVHRITKKTGTIAVTEHLRDSSNFWAYSLGFYHFYSKQTWHCVFKKANLIVASEIKTTAFITTYNLIPYGNTL